MNFKFYLHKKPILASMEFVEVLVASPQYHSQTPLTYSVRQPLAIGSVVAVSLRKQKVLGIVIRQASKPSFPTKEVEKVFPLNPLPQPLLDLLDWIRSYYPSPLGSIVQLFLPKSLSQKHLILPPLAADLSTSTLPLLTDEQLSALKKMQQAGSYLLHGETGTGKTRVYIELAKQAAKQGRSAIILTPEIGLTSQLVKDFQAVFQEQVVLIHSRLSDVARQQAYVRALQSSQPLVVIGPRSALFCPLQQVGLIVIDEAHEPAYKQEQAPHYHTTRVAARLGQLHNCQVVLGSATPLVTDYFLAEQKKRPIIRMQRLARNHVVDKRIVELVDLTERSQFTRHPYLSLKLLTAIETTLANKEQILLFLNRRGTARVVFCEQCGWQATCPHCDIPLVYHADSHLMRCHTCNFSAPAFNNCPECDNASIIFKSVGTKAVIEEVQKLFPRASVQRFDTDNKASERIEQNYEKIRAGAVDILVGTQTLAKGLDLPKLGLVGIIVADTSLYIPDFNAQERTYQLLMQVLGRVGRGHRSSKAVIQTYDPKSALLGAILKKDWSIFYQTELAERKTFLFPPFCYLLKLSCRRASQKSAERAAESLAATIKQRGEKLSVEGPTPSFHEKVAGKYQWQLIIKAKQRGELLDVIRNLPAGWTYDIDPINLL